MQKINKGKPYRCRYCKKQYKRRPVGRCRKCGARYAWFDSILDTTGR